MTTTLLPPPLSAAEVPAQPAAPPALRRPPTSLVLSGTLSGQDTGVLEQRLAQLAASGAATVEVDLSQVERIDAAVARLLLRTSWRLGDPARALLLLHPRPQVRRVLRFYGAGGLVVR